MDKDIEKIGMFLTTFNEIEAQTYVVLNLLPNDKLRKYALNIDRFEARIRFLQALLQNSSLKDKDEYHDLFNRALSLSTYRNQLSHNPLRINIYQNSKTKEFTLTSEISHAKKDIAIPQVIEQLDTRLKEISAIFYELYKLTSEYTIVE